MVYMYTFGEENSSHAEVGKSLVLTCYCMYNLSEYLVPTTHHGLKKKIVI